MSDAHPAKAELLSLFKSEVDHRTSEVDPDDNQDWFSLTLGWAVAKGLAPQAAHDFATRVRYTTDMG
jgi:hypothetical protein